MRRATYLLLLLCALGRLAFAGTAHQGLIGRNFQTASPVGGAGCSQTVSNGKILWACALSDMIWAEVWFPENTAGVCNGGANANGTCQDDSQCPSAQCEAKFGVTVMAQVNSGDTSKSICFEASLQTTTDGTSWALNDGSLGTVQSASAVLVSSSNVLIPVSIVGVESWNQTAARDCTVTACKARPAILLLKRVSCGGGIDTSATVSVIGADVARSTP